MINDRTEFLDLALPNIDNDLSDDVGRIRASLEAIDLFAKEGTASKAAKLATARTINGVEFDGTANITITAAANGGVANSATGNAGTANKLATARTINGVEFDGSANITITAAANGGTADSATGNAGTATKLATARTINGVEFDGSANITVQDNTKLPVNGIAASATKLETARTINGVDFDGTSNITLPAQPDATKLPLTGGEITGTTESTSPTTGALRIKGGLGVAKNLYVGGEIFSDDDMGITSTSDSRVKDDVQVIGDALARLHQIRGVTYLRKGKSGRRTGVIAQEVQAVLPEAVREGEELLSVAYGNLSGLIIEAIKELSREVNALKK